MTNVESGAVPIMVRPVPYLEEQMATQEGWDDFARLEERWQSVMNSICADVDRMIALSAILAENGY